MEYVKMTRSAVKKELSLGGLWTGFFVGSRVSEYHFFEGWGLACRMNIKNLEEFEHCVNNYKHYNYSSELGRVTFYKILSD